MRESSLQAHPQTQHQVPARSSYASGKWPVSLVGNVFDSGKQGEGWAQKPGGPEVQGMPGRGERLAISIQWIDVQVVPFFYGHSVGRHPFVESAK